MSKRTSRDLNHASYDAIVSDWDRARRAFHGRDREYLDLVLEPLRPGSHVLDLGCGTGRPNAAYILARGHRMTGVDQAEALLQLARERFPAAAWVHSSIEDFRAASSFDAVVCWDALFHIERDSHEDLITRMAQMLVPGGRLLLTAGGSVNSAFTDTMFGQTFFYDSHPPGVERELVERAGCEIVLGAYLNLPTSGREKGRYVIVARRI
ncbi:MAG TPA: class I SAM-dependent methyltransferase [Candidatus Binatia bacterium]|nr:class I SAM-dependent methyltransferase [Candidatus Binatia bacterium]